MTSLINSTPSLSDINEFQHVLGVAFGLNHMFEITPDCITQTYVNETSKTGSDKVHSIFFLKAPINTSKTALIYAATINLYDKERVKKILWIRTLIDPKIACQSHRDLYEQACQGGLSLQRRYLTCSHYIEFLQPFAFYGDLLQMLVNAESLTNQTLIFISKQCIELVYKLHSLGIFHRNIKPENFLVDNEGGLLKLYINDFKFATKDEKSTQILGSYEYSSLDHRLSAEIRLKQSDISSLGFTLFTLCTGHFFSDFKDPLIKDLERNPAQNWIGIEDEYKRIIYHNSAIPHLLKEIIFNFIRIHPMDRLPLEDALIRLS